jgi:MFS family permease
MGLPDAPQVDRPDADRLFTPAFIALSLAELAYFTADGLAILVTPLFAVGPLGASPAEAGLAAGAFSITALLLRPYAGRLSDRRGRRPLLIGGALAFALILAAHALVSNLPMLIVLRLMLGAAEAFFFVAAFAAVADLAPPGRAGEALSYNSLSLYLGIAFGPLLGQWLLANGGFTAAWLGGAFLAIAAVALASRIPEPRVPQPADAEPTPLFNRAVITPAFALFTGVAAMAGFLYFEAIYSQRDLGLEEAGWILFVFGMVVVVTRVAFARLPDRVPPFRLGAVSLSLCAAGLIVTGVSASVPGLVLGSVILALGVAFTTPAMFAAIFARVSPSERGSASGTASLFLDLALGGGPLLMGIVAGTFALGIGPAFIVVAALPAVGAMTALALATRSPSGVNVPQGTTHG